MKKKLLLILAIIAIIFSVKAFAKMNDKVYEVEAVASLNRFDNLIHFDCWEAETLNNMTYKNNLNLKVGDKVKVIVSYKIIDECEGYYYGMRIEIVDVKRK